MDKHAKAIAAFLTSAVAGPAFALVAYLVARKPCPPLGLTDCVFGMTLGEAATRFGVVGLVVGVVLGLAVENG